MNEKIVLIDESLCFVSTGTGKMHIADYRYRHNLLTLCGRHIPTGTEGQVTRQQSDAQVCKKCKSSLSFYMREGKVRIESEATAP